MSCSRIVRPADLCPVSGVPITCSNCGQEVNGAGYCWQDYDHKPYCEDGNKWMGRIAERAGWLNVPNWPPVIEVKR